MLSTAYVVLLSSNSNAIEFDIKSLIKEDYSYSILEEDID